MTAANFHACLAFTLKYEGGRADNPRDPGGRTNAGVTQATFNDWLASQGKVPRDVYGMTDAEKEAIYLQRYWGAVYADTLTAGVDLAAFDFAVNSGPGRALKAITRSKGNDAATVVKAICAQRLSFLHALTKLWSEFGRGWAARVAACEALGVSMAEHARIGLVAGPAPAAQVATTLKIQAGASRAQANTRHQAAGAASGTIGSVAGFAMYHGSLPIFATAIAAFTGVGALLWSAHVHGAKSDAYAAAAAPTTS